MSSRLGDERVAGNRRFQQPFFDGRQMVRDDGVELLVRRQRHISPIVQGLRCASTQEASGVDRQVHEWAGHHAEDDGTDRTQPDHQLRQGLG